MIIISLRRFTLNLFSVGLIFLIQVLNGFISIYYQNIFPFFLMNLAIPQHQYQIFCHPKLKTLYICLIFHNLIILLLAKVFKFFHLCRCTHAPFRCWLLASLIISNGQSAGQTFLSSLFSSSLHGLTRPTSVGPLPHIAMSAAACDSPSEPCVSFQY